MSLHSRGVRRHDTSVISQSSQFYVALCGTRVLEWMSRMVGRAAQRAGVENPHYVEPVTRLKKLALRRKPEPSTRH